MKKLLFIITTLAVMSSCATNKEARSSRIELRKENKLAEQAVVKDAVESRRFIIKLDRLSLSHGGIVDLIPRRNYIIVDGKRAIIRAGYIGKQLDIKPIAGINISGVTTFYELTNDTYKGSYNLKMKVQNRNTSFDVYISIGKNGSCNASLSNLNIDMVRYSGHIVPINEKTGNTTQESEMI
jgi:hypothetical protein